MPYYVFIILFSVSVDWFLVEAMVKTQKKPKRLALLLISVFSNLGLLAFFKYSGFIVENLDYLITSLGISKMTNPNSTFFQNIILPIGISFYTFQTLSYTLDVYDGKIKKSRNFTEFLFYVSSFPQLVAGPIVRFSQLRSQLKHPTVNRTKIKTGMYFFVLGFSKKVLIADSVAPLADFVFDGALVENGILNLLGVLAYSLQIYFDFSGYSEMAIGLGMFLGFKFPQNFNSPYKASSLTDFWRRWHITLSSWIRDYVYIKLGGSRRGSIRNVFNLILSITVFGLWHGANWTFLVWGLGHGLAVLCDRYLAKFAGGFVALIRRSWCLLTVIVLWIPFRATDIDVALMILNNIVFNITDIDISSLFNVSNKVDILVSLLMIIPAILISFFGKNVYEMKKELNYFTSAYLTIILLVSILVLLSRDYVPFLYFQF